MHFVFDGMMKWWHKYGEHERLKVKWCHGGIKRELMVAEWV